MLGKGLTDTTGCAGDDHQGGRFDMDGMGQVVGG